MSRHDYTVEVTTVQESDRRDFEKVLQEALNVPPPNDWTTRWTLAGFSRTTWDEWDSYTALLTRRIEHA